MDQRAGGLLVHSAGKRRRSLASGRAAVIEPGEGGKPVLELVEEAAHGLAELKVQKAEDQRAGKPEQRRGEGCRHAGKRRVEPAFQLCHHGVEIDPGGVEGSDDEPDRADCLEQPPEGAEKAEKDQKPDHVARDLASLVEPCRNAVEDRAERKRRQLRLLPLVGEHGVDGGEKDRFHLPVVELAGLLDGGQPAPFGNKAEDLPEGVGDAEEQCADDDPVQRRIAHEGAP